jgi:hypothetical protein
MTGVAGYATANVGWTLKPTKIEKLSKRVQTDTPPQFSVS